VNVDMTVQELDATSRRVPVSFFFAYLPVSFEVATPTFVFSSNSPPDCRGETSRLARLARGLLVDRQEQGSPGADLHLVACARVDDIHERPDSGHIWRLEHLGGVAVHGAEDSDGDDEGLQDGSFCRHRDLLPICSTHGTWLARGVKECATSASRLVRQVAWGGIQGYDA
jgi:hypothetical protein